MAKATKWSSQPCLESDDCNFWHFTPVGRGHPRIDSKLTMHSSCHFTRPGQSGFESPGLVPDARASMDQAKVRSSLSGKEDGGIHCPLLSQPQHQAHRISQSDTKVIPELGQQCSNALISKLQCNMRNPGPHPMINDRPDMTCKCLMCICGQEIQSTGVI